MKFKILSIISIVLTAVFIVLCLVNVFSSSRSYYASEIEEAHADLLENLDFQEELKSYGNRYRSELDLVEKAEQSLREWMWTCQQKLNEYKQKTIVFALLACAGGTTSVVFIIKRKKETCLP